LRVEDIHSLGWLESERFVALARRRVAEDILRPLASIGIVVPDEDRVRLLA
jgi:hypothetical protein